MRRFLFPLLLISLVLPLLPRTQAQESDDIGLYELFEISFTLDADIDNPYDPGDANVMATFTSPTSQRYEVPAFYMQPYEQTCESDCEAEVLEIAGEGEWRVRFTPTEVGRWRYSVFAEINGAARDGVTEGRFSVVESDNRGFVRVAGNNRYFAYDDGTPFFPVGQNLAWSWEEGGGIFTYIEWLDRLQAVGGNYARLYIDVPWFIGLEWEAPAGQYGGFGQESAWRLDRILEEAEARGIYVQLVLIWHRAFQTYPGPPVVIPRDPPRPDQAVDFASNPYNSRFSGSLNGPAGVYRDRVSQELLERRLRYIVARWGYSTHVFAWEIMDRLDEMAGFTTTDGVEWVNSLIESLREDDINNHLVTVGLSENNVVIEQGMNIDFTQSFVYQDRPIGAAEEQVEETFEDVVFASAIAERPVLVTEFSLNPWFEPTGDDESGVHIRNTQWAAVMSGAAGSAMPWWWDTYIDPLDLYGQHIPIALFTRDIAWDEVDFQLFEPGLVSDAAVEYLPLRLEDFNRQFRSATLPDTIFHVTADGSAPPVSLTTSYLYGRQFNSEHSQPQTFVISPPVDTELIVAIENVSTAAPAQLLVEIDGEPRTRLDLATGTRDLILNFPISAGNHTIVLDNLGEDWLQLAYLEVTDYVAPLRALALADIDMGVALVWIHNREYTWQTVQAGEAITPLNFSLNLPQLPPGDYRVEFWDPMTGNVIGEELVSATAEVPLRIDLLPVEKQLALRIFRDGEIGDTSSEPVIQPTRTPVAQ
ncbi:MAG: DUF5060 domain-containing protein [Chloroflexi bacterium]|nr:DUF5060 domain-containing protein [Chloroflexota bacterium]